MEGYVFLSPTNVHRFFIVEYSERAKTDIAQTRPNAKDAEDYLRLIRPTQLKTD